MLGALLAKGTLTEAQATRHIGEAVKAATSAGGIAPAAQQQLSADMQQAATEQGDAAVRQEQEAQQAKQRLADEMAELYAPKVCQCLLSNHLHCSGLGSLDLLCLHMVIFHDSGCKLRTFKPILLCIRHEARE